MHRLELDDYGVAITCNDGQIWVASRKGTLHLLDPDWNRLAEYDGNVERVTTDIKHNSGCIISACYDKKTSAGFGAVTTSGLRPHVLADINFMGQQPTKMHYSQGILACGFVDSNVRVWIPTE